MHHTPTPKVHLPPQPPVLTAPSPVSYFAFDLKEVAVMQVVVTAVRKLIAEANLPFEKFQAMESVVQVRAWEEIRT